MLQSFEDLSLLLFSPASLQLHLEQAVAVLDMVAATPMPAASNSPTQKVYI